MDSYEALAASYDELTEDVEYEKRADFVEKLFLRAKRPVKSLLDLACGTGTMTVLFARRGYTVTGVDYSPEMLAQAQQKLAAINSPPLLLCQSMPQLFNSAITIISTTVCMFMLNIPLTALTFFMVGIMLVLTRKIGGLSAKHFIAQQKDIGTVNGYIEEMMQGQRVVKVFCHEEESKEAFDKLNDALCESSYKANNYSNILGPINAQLGNISYVLCAIVGGVLAIGNVGGFTLGGLAATMSLWETDAFAAVFSLCGSFWYPGVADFIEEHVPKNYSAQVYLQNGIREGEGHNNRLCDAYSYAQRIHTALQATCGAKTVLDDYGHHDRQSERLNAALRWVERVL